MRLPAVPPLASLTHRAAMRCYPRPWRARFGRDYHDTVVARWRDARDRRIAHRLLLILFTLADTCASGLAMRLERRRTPRRLSMTAFFRHLRHGARTLRRAPGFAATAIATLSVGIGAATAAFTAFDAALLEPLPYPTGDRLVILSETRRGREISVSYPDFFDWRDTARSFEAMAAFRGSTITLTGGPIPERARAAIVTSDLFRVLGTRPLIGRAFGPDDDRRGAPRSVVLGYGLWQRAFGGDDGAVGRAIEIDGEAWRIVGVMPEGFAFPDGVVYGAADLYMPTGPGWADEFDNRDSHPGVVVAALLERAVSVEAARQEMDAIARDLAARYPDSNADIGAHTVDGVTAIVGDLRGRLTGVAGASVVLLLIACANVAGLTLTRAVARRRELLVRAALGESRGSMMTSLLAEHLVLAAAGSAGGLLLAYGLTAAVRPLVGQLPRLDHLSADTGALLFVAAAMAMTTLLVGVTPAMWLRGARIGGLGQRGASAEGVRLRQLLVGAQVGLAVLLLSTALLFAATFRNLASDTGGIRADGALSFQIALPEPAYPPARREAFFETLFERLAAHPSVTAIGAISTLPFSGAGAQSGITPAGVADADSVRVDVAGVAGDYFTAMGIPIVRGRAFAPGDGRAAPVAIVDERFAARFWPGEDPIGQRVSGWGFQELEVIGVAGHVKNYGAGAESREELYIPNAQRPYLRLFPIVRTTDSPEALIPEIRRLVADLDPDVVVGLPRTMTEVVDRTIAAPRLAATLGGLFGLVAFALAGIGIYSLVAYAVVLRRRESAIRLALGAAPRRVVGLMMRGVSTAAGIGALAGLAAAAAAGRLVENQLVGVTAFDPRVLAAACAAIAVLTLAAAWLPARRAARTPAALALQQE